jgi:HTH-type transcriptional regulator / antitoxin HipB
MGYIRAMSSVLPPAYIRRADDLGALIRSRRAILGLSQHDLAKRLMVSRKWVNEIEQGNSSARLGLVLQALNELGIDLFGQLPHPGPAKSATRAPNPDIDIDDIADMNLRRGRR